MFSQNRIQANKMKEKATDAKIQPPFQIILFSLSTNLPHNQLQVHRVPQGLGGKSWQPHDVPSGPMASTTATELCTAAPEHCRPALQTTGCLERTDLHFINQSAHTCIPLTETWSLQSDSNSRLFSGQHSVQSKTLLFYHYYQTNIVTRTLLRKKSGFSCSESLHPGLPPQ